jgi:hypothetical protein
MGFCPYFLQDHISEDKPSAGTSQTLFIWLFLFLDLGVGLVVKALEPVKECL